jgi:DNA-binding SARP family transcriptional activator
VTAAAEPNVLLLGPLRVVTANGPRAVTGHAGRLLVELVVAGPVLTRERLADALWGDDPPPSSDAALRVHLTRLRRLLDDTPLTIERRGSALELVGAITDIDECERCVRHAREVRASGATWDDIDAAAASLSAAADRWRGQPFAPYDDAPSLAASVHRVQSLRAEAEELGIDIALDRGRHRAVIADLERAVADEPFREGAWARLMVALYRDGRQRDALAAFTSARSLLVEQLGVEPGPELQRRHAQVLAQDPGLDWRPPADAPERSPIVTGIRSDRSDALIGRDKQFDATVASLGDHRLVTVCGPPGVGKSALVRAVSDAAVVEPVVVDLERVASVGAIGVAIADALGLHPDPSDGLDPLPLVLAALGDTEVIVVLDGGDRLGAGVSCLVGDLLDACATIRVLVARRTPLALPAEAVIDLPLLEPPDALALLVQLVDAGAGGTAGVGLGAVAEEASLERVVAATNGHPLSLQLAAGWIALLGAHDVAAQLEAGALPLASDPEHPFVERVEVSLRSVDQRARDAFVALAAFDGGFDVDAVAHVAQLSSRDAARVVRDLRRAALLQPDGSAGRWYLLAAIRDAALEIAERDGRLDAIIAAHEAFLLDLVAPWRSESLGFDGPGVTRALMPWRVDLRHLCERRIAAGDLDGVADLVDALYWFWDAAGLRQESARLLEQALAVGAHQPDHPQLGFLRSLFASIGGTFGWQADHLADVEQALVESQRHGHQLGIFSAHLGVALGRGWTGDLAGAEEHLELARRYVDAAPRYFGPSVDTYFALVRFAAGQHVEARRLLEQAVAAYDEMGSPWGAAHALTFLGMVAVFEGDPRRAEAVFEKTVERAALSGKVHSELHARMELADLLAGSGSEDDALVEYELVTTELLTIGDLGCAGQCLCGWAEASRTVGEVEAARWLLAEAATVGRRGRDPGVVTRAVTGLAEIALSREDRGEASELIGALDADPTRGGRPVRPGDQDRLQRCRTALTEASRATASADGPAGPARPLPAVLDDIRTAARRAGVQPPVALGAGVAARPPRRSDGGESPRSVG